MNLGLMKERKERRKKGKGLRVYKEKLKRLISH